ncbi:unnamed protein product [Rotaria sordida]|uniref:Cysteine-rich DPF motif domain-containing protein 1 n=1 Tax=Rotaria sordida TaxID=392033 RepID=A0A818L7U7_9BILA|nr:unnamed protein product [Rotaria sordida]CAF1191661.1 unnamed protein product [Rotaria sordida]CAF1279510.1 unnamed protein product [Rotaria sordida]CAF3567660.1 unnamed protein product [Rotaria sordida]CAF3772395.1 unnamed protein product [Rotaria sordida]
MTEQEIVEPKVFQCSLCPFYASYDRHDSKYIDESIQSSVSTTQNNKNKKEPSITIDLIEKVYLLRDPFVAIKDKDKVDQTKLPSLIIGSTCSVCSRPVCVHSDCSLFYTRRFCLKCVAKYRDEFPREILDEIGVKRLEKFLNEDYEQYDET